MEIQFNYGIKLQGFSLLSVCFIYDRSMSYNNFVLAFAAACTAGILIPLHLTIGIRLAKEDEVEGLDLTGKRFILFTRMGKNLHHHFFVAHGESWEIAASRAVSKLVKAILEESKYDREEARESGKFELLYTPTDRSQKAIAIPLSAPNGVLPDWAPYQIGSAGSQGTNGNKIFRF